MLRIEEGQAGETAARALGTGTHEVVQWVERVRYADGEPLALDRSALAISVAQRKAFVGGDLTQGSLYGCCGPAVAKASSRWSASPTPAIGRSSGAGAWSVAGAT